MAKAAAEASKLIPDGNHLFIVETAERVTAQSGSLMLKVKLSCQEEGSFNKRKLFTNLVVTLDNPVALSIFFRHAAALGITDMDDDASIEQSLDAMAVAIIGRLVTVNVGHKVYQGREMNEVKNLSAPDGVIQPDNFAGVGSISANDFSAGSDIAF
jgi:uncharacterized protein DUF669